MAGMMESWGGKLAGMLLLVMLPFEVFSGVLLSKESLT